MAVTTHYGRRVFLTLLATLVVLAVVTYGVVSFVLPGSGISAEDIRPILIKTFPLLVGLAMIEVGVLIARRHESSPGNSLDKLPPNAYESALHVMPQDDPVRLTAVPTADLHAPSLPSVAATLPHQPLLADTASSAAISTYHDSPRTLQEAPVITPGTTIYAQPPQDSAFVVNLPTFEDTFDSVLEKELSDAVQLGYDLSLAVIAFEGGGHSEIVSILLKNTDEASFAYELDNGKVALIFTFYTADEARSYLVGLLASLRAELPGTEFQIGLSSRDGRDIEAALLYAEAENAENDADSSGNVVSFQ